MMPYQSYQVYQAERPRAPPIPHTHELPHSRPKTAAEIRRADEQLGHMAQNVSWLWQHAIRPIALLRGHDRQPACSALLDATR